MRRAATAQTIAIAAVLAACWLSAPAAQAYRPLESEAYLKTTYCKHCTPPAEPPANPMPPPEGQLEDPCGLAIAPGGGTIYVADYYHRAVDVFSGGGTYSSQIALPGGPISGLGINELDGVCGLAIDSSGNLYANEYHQAVLRLRPTEFTLDSGESTGVALDAAGDLFVDDRTHVAVYEAPVQAGDEPAATIGFDPLADYYGLAVSADGARVYLADAATNRVRLYEPAVSLTAPQATISHSFTSLVDSALAIDPTNAHLLVLDNLQPGYEHPEAAVVEFDPAGTFLGQIRGPAGAPIVNGEPSGLAVTTAGDLLVSDGNSELGNAFQFGPYSATAPPAPSAQPLSAAAAQPDAPLASTAAATAPPLATARHRRRPYRARRHRRHKHRAPERATASEVIPHGRFRVALDARLVPHRLPRRGDAPVHFALSARFLSADHRLPPQLRRIEIEINRHGHLDRAGLPTCTIERVQPATTANALRACRSSLVGEGSFSAQVRIASEAPFPSIGKLLAFNGTYHGHPAVLAHIYGPRPVPTSYTIPFLISTAHHGAYGTVLRASLPHFSSKWGYVTSISLGLGRRFSSGGQAHSYLAAGCPAVKGASRASFDLAYASFTFGAEQVSSVLTRSCRAYD